MLKFNVVKILEISPETQKVQVLTRLIDCDDMEVVSIDQETGKVLYNISGRLYINIKTDEQRVFWESKIDNDFTIDLQFQN